MNRIKSVNILFLALVVIQLAVSFALGLFSEFISLTVNQSILISQAIIFVPVLVYLLVTRTKITELIKLKRIKISTVFMVVLFTFLMLPLIATVNAISMLFSTNIVNDTTQLMMENPFWLNLLLMAVIPAINEEFVFRGVFYQTYREKSVLWGIVGCGALFGFMHMNFNQFSYALVLGLIFALLVEATGSILAPMIGHFVLNGNSVVLMTLSRLLTDALADNQEELNAILGDSAVGLDFSAQYTQEELMITIGMLAVIAVITTSLAACVFVWISRHCGTLENIKGIFSKKETGIQEDVIGADIVREDVIREGTIRETKMQNKKKKQLAIVTAPLIIGVVLCIVVMVMAEI